MCGGTGTVYGPVGGSLEPSSGAGPAFGAHGQDPTPSRTWPLQSYLALGALPSAVPCARLHTKHVLWEWGLTLISESAELIVSEIVTNAVQATTTRVIPMPIRLWLLGDHHRVQIAIWDAEPRVPQPKLVLADGMPDWSDDGGRGLFLVDSLSQQWGWYATPEWGGKVVWAEVSS